MKPNKTEPADIAPNDQSSHNLLDSVVQQLNEGRPVAEINAELVRQDWAKDAATRFCELASKICLELKFLPEQRTARARRGYESMQGAYGWIGFGACAGVMLYLVGNNARAFSKFAFLPILFGVVELVSGLILWWPNKDYLGHETESAGSKIRKN